MAEFSPARAQAMAGAKGPSTAGFGTRSECKKWALAKTKEANTDWPYSTNQPERCAARPPRAASIPQPQPGARRSRLHLARLRRPRLGSCFSSRGSPCATRSPIRCRHGDDAKRGHLDVGDEGSSRSAPGSRFAGAVTLLSCASDKDSRSSSLTPKDAGSTCGEEAEEEA